MRKVILALVFGLVACGKAPVATVAQAPPPVLSQQRAAEIVAGYDERAAGVYARLDTDGLTRVEAPPLRTSSEARLRIARQLRRTVPQDTSRRTGFTVSSDGHWFVAAGATWTVFGEQNAQWLASYSLTPRTDPPAAAAVNAAGAATIVTDFGDLLLDPAALSQSILDHYVRDLVGKDVFARSPALDDELANDYRMAQNVMRGKGHQLDRTVNHADRHPVYALRAQDGGVLVFTAATVVDVVRATRGSVTFDANTAEGALLGRTTSAPRFTITRLQTYLTHIPPQAAGARITVLAGGDTPISVSAR